MRFISTFEGQVIFESIERGAFGNIWPVWCARPMAPAADAPPPSLCSAELVARL